MAGDLTRGGRGKICCCIACIPGMYVASYHWLRLGEDRPRSYRGYAIAKINISPPLH